MSLPPVIEAAERAVYNAGMGLGMDEGTARELTRVEVDDETVKELLAWARPGFSGDVITFMRGEGPIKIRDVSYYRVPNAPVPWRVISPARGTGGIMARVAHAAPRHREHEFDEASKQR